MGRSIEGRLMLGNEVRVPSLSSVLIKSTQESSMPDNKHDITVLNTLIATTLDSMRGYREAGEHSHSGNARYFCEMADQRSDVAASLQSEVRALGGDPQDSSSTMGGIHRQYTKLKNAIVSNDEKAIIDEV